MTPNAEQIVLAQQDQRFLCALQDADLCLADGMPLSWLINWRMRYLSFIKWLGLSSNHGQQDQQVQRNWRKQQQRALNDSSYDCHSVFTKQSLSVTAQRVTGTDLTVGLLRELSKQASVNSDVKVLVIGGYYYEYANLLVSKSPCWQFVLPQSSQLVNRTTDEQECEYRFYWTVGYADITKPSPREEKELEKLLFTLRPRLVLLSFGAPHQELWLTEHRQLLDRVGVRVAMAVGGGVDYLFGKQQRAPLWMQKIGLEWLFRLYKQPWRWRRQTKLFQFVLLLLKSFWNKQVWR